LLNNFLQNLRCHSIIALHPLFHESATMLRDLYFHRGFQTVFLIGAYLALSPWLPMSVPRFFYTLSVLIKETLAWILPFSVCFFIAHSIGSFKRQALLFLTFLILFEGISNFISVCFSYTAGRAFSPFFDEILCLGSSTHSLASFCHLPLQRPLFLTADKGAIVGALIGIVCYLLNQPLLYRLIDQGKAIAQTLLTRFFSPLAPLFILGFIVKMHQEKTLSFLFSHYLLLVGCIAALLIAYISLLLIAGNKGAIQPAWQDALRLIPPGIMAFTSGCSLSTMPWTIAATGSNLKNPKLAESVIPATTNIQQIGDCITNSFLCFLIYYSTYHAPPSWGMWLNFTTLFVLARYATAAVMGGAIFLMLPIYEKTLNFSPEMLATILAFNVVLDPLITAANVLANGALCKIFENAWMMIQSRKPQPERY
jgi:Na+/H+-dicarboxylate symporter